jgi:cell division protein FtsB
MTYFWICVSAWLSLNAAVIAQIVHDVRADRRDARTLRAAEKQLEQDRVAERRRIMRMRGAR